MIIIITKTKTDNDNNQNLFDSSIISFQYKYLLCSPDNLPQMAGGKALALVNMLLEVVRVSMHMPGRLN